MEAHRRHFNGVKKYFQPVDDSRSIKTRHDGRVQVFVCVLRELRTMGKVRAIPRHVNMFMPRLLLFPRVSPAKLAAAPEYPLP